MTVFGAVSYTHLDVYKRQVGIRCDGEELDPKEDPVVTIKSGESLVCDFENRFTPAGSIVVRVVTLNGTGSVSYLVSSNNENEPFTGSREATTKAENETTKTTGDDLNKLPLVGYTCLLYTSRCV